MDGMSPPSNRTGFRPETTTTAHQPGSRQSSGSRLRDNEGKTKAPRRYRDAETGRFVSKKYAGKNRKTTVKESFARPVVTGR
jgi:hypothetical protein